ncbi:hypothetical protein SAMN05216582_102129 [Selenomonas ruminantium]|uniref:DUF192 domain-containing protein n=1 Tax=Selenomonas ruminantium TaxID=971 RepID=A0A1M6RL24_SELRU|nr:DUF192 domain-containing protein [Selenomonas ruminantium]SHK33129.1 hypothetical protein SAMN05216582_102129 [Selenomonas ruminantium]
MKLQMETADTFFRRFRGLMLRKELPAGKGLLIAPCSSIHMCFMRFAIDAIWVDKDMNILKISRNVKPWIGLAWCPGAWGVVEMTAGEADRLGLQSSTRIPVERNSSLMADKASSSGTRTV